MRSMKMFFPPHFCAGSAIVLAEITKPSFAAMCLIEPIILDPTVWKTPANPMDNPLSARTLKRRAMFESLEAAHAYCKGRAMFSSWDTRCL